MRAAGVNQGAAARGAAVLWVLGAARASPAQKGALLSRQEPAFLRVVLFAVCWSGVCRTALLVRLQGPSFMDRIRGARVAGALTLRCGVGAVRDASPCSEAATWARGQASEASLEIPGHAEFYGGEAQNTVLFVCLFFSPAGFLISKIFNCM